jgi:hypothetical protein
MHVSDVELGKVFFLLGVAKWGGRGLQRRQLQNSLSKTYVFWYGVIGKAHIQTTKLKLNKYNSFYANNL